MKRGSAENQNGGVDEQGEKEGDGGIDYGVTQGFAFFRPLSAEGTGLHDAGVQIEIVGHHGGAEDADGDIEHFFVTQDFRVRNETTGGFPPDRVSEKDFVRETEADAGDERDNEGFDKAEATALQGEDDEDVQARQQNAEEQRDVEKEIEGNGGAQDLGEVTGGDGEFAGDPEKHGRAAGIVVAAGLGEVASGGDAKFRRERLQKHREHVADKDDAKKRVSELGAASDIGCPVAGVHVSDGDEIAWAGESQDFAKPVRVVRDGNAAMGLGKRG